MQNIADAYRERRHSRHSSWDNGTKPIGSADSNNSRGSAKKQDK